jgi:hypothetical protein
MIENGIPVALVPSNESVTRTANVLEQVAVGVPEINPFKGENESPGQAAAMSPAAPPDRSSYDALPRIPVSTKSEYEGNAFPIASAMTPVGPPEIDGIG